MSWPRFSQRVSLRRLAVLPVIGLTVVAVAGCDRPTPYVSLQSGKTFVKTTASQYVRGGTVKKYSPKTPTLTVHPGDSIGIDVAKSVADSGYYLSAEGQKISDVVKTTHYKLTISPTATGKTQIVLFQNPKGSSSTGTATGSWVFNLSVTP